MSLHFRLLWVRAVNHEFADDPLADPNYSRQSANDFGEARRTAFDLARESGQAVIEDRGVKATFTRVEGGILEDYFGRTFLHTGESLTK